MLVLAAILAVLALCCYWLARRQARLTGMPGGRLIYADTHAWTPVQDALYDSRLGLTGKPDYLVRQDNQVIPVEVKSARVDQAPYDSHIYQLAAYCLLVSRTVGVRPSYGIIHYPNRTYRIEFTGELESATLSLLEEIHEQHRRKEAHRSHDNPARCSGCGFRSICDQRLT